MGILDKFKVFAGSVKKCGRLCAEKCFGVSKDAMRKGANLVFTELGKTVKEYLHENEGRATEIANEAGKVFISEPNPNENSSKNQDEMGI